MRKNKDKLYELILLVFLSVILCVGGTSMYSPDTKTVFKSKKETVLYTDKGPHEESALPHRKAPPSIPPVYLYRSGNNQALKEYLQGKNSLLAEEPYFSEILKQAEIFNLNPCLLFAITGREQSFVPKNHKFAYKISNNPFNVFYSWENYNTDISDSAKIACRTIISLSKDRPPDKDFIMWINTRNGKGGYAEDPLWHTDVKIFFEYLNNRVY